MRRGRFSDAARAIRRLVGGARTDRAPLDLISFGVTHVGLIRETNQDRFLCARGERLWAIADGMGGHDFGERAAELLIEALESGPFSIKMEAARDALVQRIEAANATILAEGDARGTSMGSTIVALLMRQGRYSLCWVGDSRAYLLRDGVFTQISRDHSQVQDMIDSGSLEPEAAADHPMAHVLTRVVGVSEEVEVATAEGEVLPGDLFLLSSDGLHSYVPQDEIVSRLHSQAPRAAVQELLEETLRRGAPDNVTIVAILAAPPDEVARSGGEERE
jgi:serine/threonine-protein phosphatase Stp1